MKKTEERTTALGETTRRKRAEKPAVLKTVGIVSEEIREQESRKLSPEERNAKVLRTLKRSARDSEILWGEVYAVEMSEALKKPVVLVMFSNAQVAIPFDEYFEPTFNFGEVKNEAELNRRMLIQARYQLGAKVCFIPASAIEVPFDEETMSGGYIFAVASRRKAMAKLREIWFSANGNRQVPEVKQWDKAKAHVLAVREDHAIVECLGIETRINDYNLNDEFVENCQDFVSPGDEIDVSIKTLEYKEKGIYLVVTGRSWSDSKKLAAIKIEGTYLGTVDCYSRKLGAYIVRLPNGALASVRDSELTGSATLEAGNKVSVLITRKNGDFAYGKAMKLR